MKIIATIKEISKLLKATVILDKSEEGKKIFNSFTDRHPKYKIIKNKTIGVALLDLSPFKSSEDYIKSVNGKNSAAYFSRKAVRSGYSFEAINPHKYQDSIGEINNSATSRQGRDMDASYKKKMDFPANANNLYFGIFKEKKMIAYLWVIRTGELAVLNRLLGHVDHLDAGIMYLLITSFIVNRIEQDKQLKYVMYDTFFGARDGLKLFKTRFGFKPYNVRWKQTE